MRMPDFHTWDCFIRWVQALAQFEQDQQAVADLTIERAKCVHELRALEGRTAVLRRTLAQ